MFFTTLAAVWVACASVSWAGYASSPNGDKRVLVCEHKPAETISCPSGTVINVLEATYGHLEDHCYPNSVKNCAAQGATAKTSQICDGKRSCSLLAANSIYGDPCVGVKKYLEVKYTCLRHKHVMVCEHKPAKTISCPSGTVIYVLGAFYGHLENHCYVDYIQNCRAQGATAKTRERCDGKRSCSLLAANSVYGDPCVGVKKYLDVKYTCLPSGGSYATICEGKTSTITCPEGTLDVSYANYGRLDPETCGRTRSFNCAASASSSKVRQTCNGKSSCRLTASNGWFGDPCRGVYKYLTVIYKCNSDCDLLSLLSE